VTRAELLIESMIQSKQIAHGKVLAVHEDELVMVTCEGEKTEKFLCDILQTSEGTGLRLTPGDTVLVWLPEDDKDRGVVLGRIGPSRAAVSKEKEKPDEIVIEAKKNLTFKCGDGSITLRKDGKILIKGKDLVSRAKRMNRIKGGSVAIN
jgi:translation initiation factor IF-1